MKSVSAPRKKMDLIFLAFNEWTNLTSSFEYTLYVMKKVIELKISNYEKDYDVP